MALSMRSELESGIVLEESYVRIQSLSGNKNVISISVEVFGSQSLCEEGKQPISFKGYFFTPSNEETAPRWDKQAYEYLKTLPEFENATDILE
ncbi:hypothetical protein [Paenibacillus odorifer]|uniref:Uncharacterized protein n=1 Tax=Paenibacillus odorifer TaxID=189426 RepID=A0A1R0XAW0_9BACL|nr:hypothetical protein [Paenibacillus odorifer]OMD32088.1 hypothetical protein BJP51_15955 [Paenibacillus odorifer]